MFFGVVVFYLSSIHFFRAKNLFWKEEEISDGISEIPSEISSLLKNSPILKIDGRNFPRAIPSECNQQRANSRRASVRRDFCLRLNFPSEFSNFFVGDSVADPGADAILTTIVGAIGREGSKCVVGGKLWMDEGSSRESLVLSRGVNTTQLVFVTSKGNLPFALAMTS